MGKNWGRRIALIFCVVASLAIAAALFLLNIIWAATDTLVVLSIVLASPFMVATAVLSGDIIRASERERVINELETNKVY